MPLIVHSVTMLLLAGFLLLFLSLPALGEETPASAAPTALPATTGMERMSSQGAYSGELFGSRSGRFHPFLFLSEQYTDNLFNVSEDEEEEEDFITIISPGIWVSFPAGDRQPLTLSTISSAPGGVAVTRFPVEARRRLQGYALYRADIFRHADISAEDKVYQRAEGLFNINLRGGLSLELVDIFEIKRDPNTTGASTDEITSNLIYFMTNLRVTEKTRLRADLSRYRLEFDEEENAFREREDNIAALYLFYRLLPRTSLLLEYDFLDIEYRREELADSSGQVVYAGLRWEASEKSDATLKVGHSWRDLEGAGNREDVIGEFRISHRFTPKTSVSLALTRRVEETDVTDTRNLLSHRAQLIYRQKLASRLFTTIDLSYNQKDYRGQITQDGRTDSREDDLSGATVSVGYLFRPWLTFGLGYSYEERDSNFASYDFSANTVYLSATASL